MIIYSRIDDTPNILTTDYLGYYDADYAKQIRERNQYALGWHLLNESGYYAENWPLWLPDKEDEVDPETSLAIVKRLEWGRSYQRRALAQAQWAGIDIYDLLGVHHLLQRMNGLAQRENLLQGTTDFGWMTVANTVGLTHRHYDVFDKHITKFNADVADYFNASDADKPRLLKNIESQRAEIAHLFKDQLKAFKLYNKKSLFKEKLTAANTDALKAWDVQSPFIARDIDMMTRSIGYANKGCILFDFGLTSYNVYQDIRQQQPGWQMDAAKQTTKFGANLTISAFAEMGFTILIELTPVGWIGTVIIAAVTAVAMLGLDHEIDKFSF